MIATANALPISRVKSLEAIFSLNLRRDTIRLLEQNTLRSLDAIHIASAIEWNAELFVSADKRQIQAAENGGLAVHFV